MAFLLRRSGKKPKKVFSRGLESDTIKLSEYLRFETARCRCKKVLISGAEMERKMRYFFESKIEKKEKGYMIQIPFNVWEVCKQRDVIQGDLVLDNKIIDCELLPKEKGNYEIHIMDDDAVNVELGVPHKILLHVNGSLIRMDQNSPFSFEKPIRHIDSMEVILQPEDGLCGQACVAMLAGVTIAEVISVMDCREWQATMGRIISALNYYGIDHNDIIVYTEGTPYCLNAVS